MKVVRYFHIREPNSTHGGFTAKVSGETANVNQVGLQVVRCSERDAYVKKIGRSLADKAPVKLVQLRYLPTELENINPGLQHWDFAVRYFLPKS
jgi:hypothetical protein